MGILVHRRSRSVNKLVTEGSEFMTCPRCGGETPGDNLNCIYCGDPLPHRLGVFTRLRYGGKGLLFAAAAAAAIAAFLALLLL